jgi:FAD/FMN-containing dehydrogenase
MPVVPDLARIVERLRAALRGDILLRGDDAYDTARKIHNGMIDRFPSLIVRCADASDVIQAVNVAREHRMLLSVMGGGHGVSGFAVCEHGLMVDLSRMKTIQVDRAHRTVRAEGGVTWGEFDRETQAVGMATTGGIERTTGIAGLTLAGGYGFLMRKHGLACDNLISAEIVTADGRLLRASAEENADLYWGIRGGGGNFGIVTTFEYRIHEVGPVYGGMVIYPMDRARDLIRYYDEFVTVAPDNLGPLLILGTLPDGTKAVILLLCYCGPIEEGKSCLEPLLAHGTPIANQLAPMPYEAVQSIVEKFNPRGLRNYWKTSFLKHVVDEAAGTMVERFLASPSPYSHVVLYTLGGAMSRVNPGATAVEHRDARHALLTVGMWDDASADEDNIGWVQSLSSAMESFSSGGFYANFDSDASADRVRLAYGPARYKRLQSLKDKYDPANIFRLNHNIHPTHQPA